MSEWIASNNQVISVLANVGMLIVWVAYLQIFVGSYRRQRRPKILVNHGAGSGLGARCLVSNMSADPIYVLSVIATIDTLDGRWTCPITDLQDSDEVEALPDLSLATRQGPLQPGQVMDIGPFRTLMEHVVRHGPPRQQAADLDIDGKITAFEVTIAAVYGSEDLLAGASRRFDLVRQDDELRLRSHSVDTKQIRSRRERKKISRVIEDDL